MKHQIPLIRIIILIILAVAAGVGSYKMQMRSLETVSEEAPQAEIIPEPIEEEIIIEKTEYIPEPITEVPLVRTSQFVNLSFEEMDLLESIAMAEARGEGTLGMAYVMRVVINRSIKDGKNIKEVIYAPGQFYTEGMGLEPSEECHEALAMIMDGWDESQGAIFFNKYGYRSGREALFQYGHHYFSK